MLHIQGRSFDFKVPDPIARKLYCLHASLNGIPFDILFENDARYYEEYRKKIAEGMYQLLASIGRRILRGKMRGLDTLECMKQKLPYMLGLCSANRPVPSKAQETIRELMASFVEWLYVSNGHVVTGFGTIELRLDVRVKPNEYIH